VYGAASGTGEKELERLLKGKKLKRMLVWC